MPFGTQRVNTLEVVLSRLSEVHDPSAYEAAERLVHTAEAAGFDIDSLLRMLDQGMTFESLLELIESKAAKRLPDKTGSAIGRLARKLMNFLEWSKSNVDYGRRLMDSAVEGARTGEGELLKDESLAVYLERSARHAVAPTVIGTCVGLLGGYLGNGRRNTTRALTCAFLGGAIGFGAGVVWENRKLIASVASGAWKNLNRTRDERWFEKNPIDYA